MRIAIYVNRAYVAPTFAQAVSGHIQIPLGVAARLIAAGHDVVVITAHRRDGEVAASMMPVAARVRTVVNATHDWPRSGFSPLHALAHLAQLVRSLRSEQPHIVHAFGADRTGVLLGVASAFWPRASYVFTPVQSRRLGRVARFVEPVLLNRFNRITPSSAYVASLLAERGVASHEVVRPGVIKDLRKDVDWARSHAAAGRKSVLFLRNASHSNGADVAIQAFETLAPRFPELEFVFAIRPHDVFDRAIVALCAKNPNIKVHHYPYSDGITFAGLLRSACCVVLPMRRLSLNPLITLLEVMQAGVPVVTTDVESNRELVRDGVRGLLVPPDSPTALVAAIESMLNDRTAAGRLAANAQEWVGANCRYDAMTERYLQHYRQLFEASNRPGGERG